MLSLKLGIPLVLRPKKLVLMGDNPHSLTSTTKPVWKASFPNSVFWVHSYKSWCPLVVRLLSRQQKPSGLPGEAWPLSPGHTFPPKLRPLEMSVLGLLGIHGWNGDLFVLWLRDIMLSYSARVRVFPRGQ